VDEARVYFSPHHPLISRGNRSYAFKVGLPTGFAIGVIEKGLGMVAEEDGVKGETRDT
jgi:hypothetical protein